MTSPAPAPSACAARKARRRARRERRAAASRAATEAALGRTCPRCRARPGAWCGSTHLGPWMHDHVPAIAIGAVHVIAGIGAKVGDWPLIPGHMGFHNW